MSSLDNATSGRAGGDALPGRPVPPTPERLCVHTATTRPLPLEVAVDEYVEAGVHGITVWRDALAGRNVYEAGERIRGAGLEVVSLCRGGFFVSPSEEKRAQAIEENRAIVREAAELGAPLIVLVVGADPAVPLPAAREQIREGIEATLPLAEELGVRLAIEPLHPMYADSRSAVTDIATANDLCDRIGSPWVGVAVDVYHLWFDPVLEQEIARAGAAGPVAGRAAVPSGAGSSAPGVAGTASGAAPEQTGGASAGRIFAFHVCDWRTPTRDLLTDRGLMGEGCIDIPKIRGWVEQAGFSGFNEVEIFSTEYWALDQRAYLNRIVSAYEAHV